MFFLLNTTAIFSPIIWLFSEGEGDGIKCRQPSKIFFTLDILDCQENTHVNNLLESTTTNTVSRWTIDCNHGVWTQSWKNCQNWYGWRYENEDKVGSIITTLSGSGRARLDFGNCNTIGTVKAFLDGQEIGSADALTKHKVVKFNFNHGSVLKISEYDYAIIQFNNFEIIDCKSSKDFNPKSVMVQWCSY